ncbi:hypothetical protein EV363DRAFT_1296706 [Boletus edulis]|nr:hypothetical protein EV363DRAFT_1296706 [Boletus edulis]
MNKLETGPGGQRVVQGANRDVKCKTKHGSDTDCIHMIRRGDGKGTATSAVHCDSKRVETGTLAIYQCLRPHSEEICDLGQWNTVSNVCCAANEPRQTGSDDREHTASGWSGSYDGPGRFLGSG